MKNNHKCQLCIITAECSSFPECNRYDCCHRFVRFRL